MDFCAKKRPRRSATRSRIVSGTVRNVGDSVSSSGVEVLNWLPTYKAHARKNGCYQT
jgi:hypothetical protein